MSDEDYRARAKRQFDIWRQTWVEGTDSEDSEPIFAYGHMIKYLIEPDHTPFLDLLGGGGFVPHGHGNQVIGEAMSKMANQAYQTSGRGDHVYAATAEFMVKVEEHLPLSEPHWQFASSENEAFLLLMEALSYKYTRTVVINGPRAWPNQGKHVNWATITTLEPGGPWWNADLQDTAFVVYPVNPETFELVSTNTLTLLDSLTQDDSNTLVWDTSVTAGWTREPLDVHPHADAVLLGGALGGGLPFGAVVSRTPLLFPDSGRWSATAGGALTTQLGLHALLLTEGSEVRDRYDRLVAAVGREVENLQIQLPEIVRDVTGGGLLGGLRLSSVDEAGRVVRGLRDRGVLVGTLGVDHGFVTFAVSRSTDPFDVAELFDKMFEILTEEGSQ